MKPRRLFWQLYPSYLLIALISVAAIGWYASSSVQRFYYTQVAEDFKASAHIIEEQILAFQGRNKSDDLDKLCKTLGAASQRRITVIETSGRVIADSEENPQQMDSHSDRPEIIQAMKGRPGYEIRFSHTLGLNMMYVAVPLKSDDKIVAVLRIAKSVSSIDRQLKTIYYQIIISSLIIAIVAAMVSLTVSRKLSRPLEELKKGAELFANGDLSHKLPVANCQEIDAVAKAMNQMAGGIDERIRTICRQRNEHKAVLSSMSEAVLAVDNEQKLITLNSSAIDMIGVDISQAKGRTLQEVIRNSALQQFVKTSLSSDDPIESNIILRSENKERFLWARSNALQDEQGEKIGVLVVLNDITRLRQLEQVRRDFVANVSHELKTPITSIKGFVETLLEGAIKKPEEAKRFMDIIARQTRRMDAIIDDLLALSRIEQQSEKAEIELQNGRIKDAIEAAIEICQNKAQAKQIEIELRCADDIVADINIPLLIQAVANLLDNAIKYSPSSSKIEVTATQADEQISITVTDFGCGIDNELLDRIFERFYVVDKARSRKLGGTGLGLAIVKHIVQAHNGSVTVESFPETGSTFTIKLPA
jgi:two-component system, OmpR family, phosphate regulon sensor histidine kinase PhoR